MPTSDKGWQLVNDFVSKGSFTKASLAKKYDVSETFLNDVLARRVNYPTAHELILQIIEDFKLGRKET